MDMKSEQEMWPDILMLHGLITTQNVDWPGLTSVLWLKNLQMDWWDSNPNTTDKNPPLDFSFADANWKDFWNIF